MGLGHDTPEPFAAKKKRINMLYVALVFLCLAQMLHFSRHWLTLTQKMREDARDVRVRSELNWKTQRRNPSLSGGERTGLFGRS